MIHVGYVVSLSFFKDEIFLRWIYKLLLAGKLSKDLI